MSEIQYVSGDEQVERLLVGKLLAKLREAKAQGVNSKVILSVQTGDRVVAGLHGVTSYGWLLVKVLWVDPMHRRDGWGRALIERAEAVAPTRGCHSTWLNTSDAAARVLNTALGFTEFRLLKNCSCQLPTGHQRWFLQPPIAPETD